MCTHCETCNISLCRTTHNPISLTNPPLFTSLYAEMDCSKHNSCGNFKVIIMLHLRNRFNGLATFTGFRFSFYLSQQTLRFFYIFFFFSALSIFFCFACCYCCMVLYTRKDIEFHVRVKMLIIFFVVSLLYWIEWKYWNLLIR